MIFFVANSGGIYLGGTHRIYVDGWGSPLFGWGRDFTLMYKVVKRSECTINMDVFTLIQMVPSKVDFQKSLKPASSESCVNRNSWEMGDGLA